MTKAGSNRGKSVRHRTTVNSSTSQSLLRTVDVHYVLQYRLSSASPALLRPLSLSGIIAISLSFEGETVQETNLTGKRKPEALLES